MRCPACSAALLILERDGLEADYCAACHGVWLDAGEAEWIAARAGADPAAVMSSLGVITSAKHGGRRCPRCERTMRLVDAGPTLDGCPAGHGWWFDAGELEQFLAGGAPAGAELIRASIAKLFGKRMDRSAVNQT